MGLRPLTSTSLRLVARAVAMSPGSERGSLEGRRGRPRAHLLEEGQTHTGGKCQAEPGRPGRVCWEHTLEPQGAGASEEAGGDLDDYSSVRDPRTPTAAKFCVNNDWECSPAEVSRPGWWNVAASLLPGDSTLTNCLRSSSDIHPPRGSASHALPAFRGYVCASCRNEHGSSKYLLKGPK